MSSAKRVSIKRFKGLQIIAALVVVGLLAAVGVWKLSGSQAATVPGGAASLSITPTTASVQNGQQVTLSLRVNPGGVSINAVQADIQYPTAKLEYVSMSGVCAAPFTVTAQQTQTSGSVQIACGAGASFSTAQTVASVTFRAISGTGSASVAYASSSSVVQASNATNVLGSTAGSTLTLTSNGTSGTVPIYRLANPYLKERLFTASSAERDFVVQKYGYVYEGIGFRGANSTDAGAYPVYRLASPYTGERLFTKSTIERSNAVSIYGYVDEGIAFYGTPSGTAGKLSVYRLANPYTRERLFTVSSVERDMATGLYGYVYEGIGWDSPP